jgi:gephyrin
MQAAVITVSDRVSRGEAEDKTGPALIGYLQSIGYRVEVTTIVPDETSQIQSAVLNATQRASLVITTGGTGCGMRDVTPEAVKPLLDRETSGFTIAMMTASLQKTPLASLSRPVTGIRGKSLILTLPGSVKGALENLQSLAGVLGHALELLGGTKDAGESFHQKLHGGHSHHHKGHTCAHLSNDPTQLTKRARESPFPMIEYQDALSTVLHYSKRLDPVVKSIDEPLAGYVLAENVVAKEAVPAYRASIVDGYAVYHTDGPGMYPVQSSMVAGSHEGVPLQRGQIVRITTGAPVPPGATAVVMVEDTKLIRSSADGTQEETVEILVSVKEGQFIREIGSDIALGETVLAKDHVMSSLGGEVGTLASIGVSEVRVYKKPVVSVLSTGNELVPVTHSGPLPYGSIRDANRPALKAYLEQCGYSVVDLGIASDKYSELI